MSCALDCLNTPELDAAMTCLPPCGQPAVDEIGLLEAVVRLLEPPILEHWYDDKFDKAGVIRAICAKALRALGRHQSFEQPDYENLRGEDLKNAVHWAAIRLAATREAVEQAYESGWHLEVQERGKGRYAGMRSPRKAGSKRQYMYVGTLV